MELYKTHVKTMTSFSDLPTEAKTLLRKYYDEKKNNSDHTNGILLTLLALGFNLNDIVQFLEGNHSHAG